MLLGEALKLASNARCFANRAVASLYLGNFEQCLEELKTSKNPLVDYLLAAPSQLLAGYFKGF